MRHTWVLLSVLLTFLIGGLLFTVAHQAEASLQREYRFNDTFRLASHLLSDYARSEYLWRQMDTLNKVLQDELNERPLNQAGKPHRTF